MTSSTIDLFKFFQIYNSSFRYNSCVGFAPSKGKRCGWEMYGSSVAEQLQVISNRLSNRRPTHAELMEVATQALCHYHKRQAREVATKWKNLVDDLDLEDLSERMRNARMNDDNSNARFGADRNTREEAKKQQEEKEEKERQRRAQEEEDRKRKEERARENARKEQERKKREAEGERRSWRQAWTRYAQAQEIFIARKARNSSAIPWPVKTGLCRDVNEQNVIAFYHNALTGSSIKDASKIMQRECLIWHPDKAKQFVLSITLTAVEEANMAVIARMVIELHKEFRERRAS